MGIVCAVSTLWSADARGGGTFFLALDHTLTDTQLSHSFTTHEVHETGISCGLILPIAEGRYFLSYKGAAAFHGVTDIIYGSAPGPDDEKYYRNLDQYIGSLHALVFGRRFGLSRSLYVEPMVGAGVLVNIIYGNHGEGLAYGSYAVDLTILTMYELKRVSLGALLTLDYIPLDGYGGKADISFLTFGIALSL